MSGTKVQIKYGFGRPSDGSLKKAELAVDLDDNSLWTADQNNDIVRVGHDTSEIEGQLQEIIQELAENVLHNNARNDIVEGTFQIVFIDNDADYPVQARIGYQAAIDDPHSLEGSIVYVNGKDGTVSIGRDGKLIADDYYDADGNSIIDRLDGLDSHNHDGIYEPVIDPKNTAFNKDFGTTAGTVAEGNHNHSGVYEPVINPKNTAFNKDFGTAEGTVAEGNHNHDLDYADINHDHHGVYEPVIDPKNTAFNKDFGTTAGTVAEGNHNHSGVYEPVINPKNTAFNKNFGTTSGTVSEGDHTHSDYADVDHDHNGVYEPVIDPKKTAFNKDFGTTAGTVAEGNHDHKLNDLSDVNAASPTRDDLLVWNGSVWEANDFDFIQTALNFKGGINVANAAPAAVKGDLYVNDTEGPASASWTGIVGRTVKAGNFIGYANSRWYLLGDMADIGVTDVLGGLGVSVDDSKPSEPVVNIDRDEVDKWYAAPDDILWKQSGDDIYYNDGNVGIGTDNPAVKLNVVGGNADQLFLDNSGERFTQATLRNNGVTKSSWSYDLTTDRVDFYSSDSLGFSTGGETASQKVIIDSSGRVGIGGDPGTRTAGEYLEQAKTKIASWKAEVKKRAAEQPEASTQEITLEVTDGDFGVMPTEQVLAEKLMSRAIGGGDAKLQVDGGAYFRIPNSETFLIDGKNSTLNTLYIDARAPSPSTSIPINVNRGAEGYVLYSTGSASSAAYMYHDADGTVVGNNAGGAEVKLKLKAGHAVEIHTGLSVDQGTDAEQPTLSALRGNVGINGTPGSGAGTIDGGYAKLQVAGDGYFSGTIYGNVDDVAAHIKAITPTQIANWDAGTGGGGGATTDGRISDEQIIHWDQAYGWGNHANAGYQPAGDYQPAGNYLTSIDAGNGTKVTGNKVEMSGSYTGDFTATGDGEFTGTVKANKVDAAMAVRSSTLTGGVVGGFYADTQQSLTDQNNANLKSWAKLGTGLSEGFWQVVENFFAGAAFCVASSAGSVTKGTANPEAGSKLFESRKLQQWSQSYAPVNGISTLMCMIDHGFDKLQRMTSEQKEMFKRNEEIRQRLIENPMERVDNNCQDCWVYETAEGKVALLVPVVADYNFACSSHKEFNLIKKTRSQLPDLDELFDLWRLDGKNIAVDLNQAREYATGVLKHEARFRFCHAEADDFLFGVSRKGEMRDMVQGLMAEIDKADLAALDNLVGRLRNDSSESYAFKEYLV